LIKLSSLDFSRPLWYCQKLKLNKIGNITVIKVINFQPGLNFLMLVKILIVVLMIAMLISLFSSAVFMIKDKKGAMTRSFMALRVRVIIAGLLLLTLAYGLYSGQIVVNSPWG
jgi:hypothetical protein